MHLCGRQYINSKYFKAHEAIHSALCDATHRKILTLGLKTQYWKICLQTFQHCFLSAFYFCFDLLYWICIAKLLVLLPHALVFTPTEGRWHVHNNPLIWSKKHIDLCVKSDENFSVSWMDKATFYNFVDKDKELITWLTKATHEVTY